VRFIDLFGGIGGFRLGLEKASDKYECVDYIEKNKECVKQYNEYFQEDYEPRDITEIKAKDITRHDILTAGFPCQDFSVAGERKGLEGERGTLFYEVARVAKHHRPRLLFLENVKGLLNSDGGRTFARILHRLDELGYDAEWQLLNSKAFGVPQNRERVFIIASLREQRVGRVFPISRESQRTAIRWAKKQVVREPKPRRSARAIITPKRIEKRQNGRRIKNTGEPMFTLTGKDIHGIQIQSSKEDTTRIRLLTPREYHRMQGFPDTYNVTCSKTQAYNQAGNAVTTTVITSISEELHKTMTKKTPKQHT